jgi:hypothetical protein
LTTAGVTTNLQTIQYTPNQNILRFSFAEVGTPAYLLEPTEVWTDSLFTLVGIQENPADNNQILISPNPCTGITNITIDLPVAESFKCHITNSTGKLVKDYGSIQSNKASFKIHWDTENVNSGLYLFVMEYFDQKSNSKIITSEKIIILH